MFGDRTPPTAGAGTQNLYQMKQAKRTSQASALGSIAKVAKGGIKKLESLGKTKNPMGGTNGMVGE